jgi:hypothetical protein
VAVDVFGDDSFGDVKRVGYLLVRTPDFKFETQDVFDKTHSDPSGIGHVGSSKKLVRLARLGWDKNAQHLHAA